MRVFIENDAGSRRKNIYDEGTLAHLRSVEVSAAYPFPYGLCSARSAVTALPSIASC